MEAEQTNKKKNKEELRSSVPRAQQWAEEVRGEL